MRESIWRGKLEAGRTQSEHSGGQRRRATPHAWSCPGVLCPLSCLSCMHDTFIVPCRLQPAICCLLQRTFLSPCLPGMHTAFFVLLACLPPACIQRFVITWRTYDVSLVLCLSVRLPVCLTSSVIVDKPDLGLFWGMMRRALARCLNHNLMYVLDRLDLQPTGSSGVYGVTA